jgi:AcrR family transcriptional regulator
MDASFSQARPEDGDQPLRDGRRERSRSSRAKIVAALLELVGNGDVNPSASRVAQAAGVGLRTVFRHFDDMDSLYREMSLSIEAKVMPVALAPFKSEHWRDRIRELIERRIAVFEAIMPYRISSSLKRYQSEFVMQEYQRMLRLEQASIDAILPAEILRNQAQAQAIAVPLSFQCWRLLRHDQGRDVAQARTIVQTLVEAVLAQLKAA